MRTKKRIIALITTALLVIGVAIPTASYAETGTVSHHGDIDIGSYGLVGKYTVNGSTAFCCEHYSPAPSDGATATRSTLTNANCAKVLFYGYNGYAEWDGFKSTNDAIVCTSLLLSYYYDDDSVKSQDNYGSISGYSFTAFKKYVESQDTSLSGTKVYLYKIVNYQDMMQAAVVPGTLSLTKASSNTDITKGNSCYSLAGTTYTVYDSSGDVAATITMDASGKSDSVTLVPGKYTIKETKAGKGYKLDSNTYSVTISAGETTTKALKDTPLNDPTRLILNKADKETGKQVAVADGELTGAEFTVDYYDGYYSKASEVANLTPTRSWVLKTGNDGKAYLRDDFKVSGDEFYYYSTGDPTFPLSV